MNYGSNATNRRTGENEHTSQLSHGSGTRAERAEDNHGCGDGHDAEDHEADQVDPALAEAAAEARADQDEAGESDVVAVGNPGDLRLIRTDGRGEVR